MKFFLHSAFSSSMLLSGSLFQTHRYNTSMQCIYRGVHLTVGHGILEDISKGNKKGRIPVSHQAGMVDLALNPLQTPGLWFRSQAGGGSSSDKTQEPFGGLTMLQISCS